MKFRWVNPAVVKEAVKRVGAALVLGGRRSSAVDITSVMPAAPNKHQQKQKEYMLFITEAIFSIFENIL